MGQFWRLLSGRPGVRHMVFLVLIFTNTVVWMDLLQFSLLSPFWSKDLSLAGSEISSATAAYLLGYFPLILVAGMLADILGPRRMLLTCLAGVIVLSASVLLVSNYTGLWFRNLLYGVFLGFLWAPVNKLMACWLSPRELPTFGSIWAGSSAFNGVITALLAIPIASRFNWRLPFLIVALLAVPAFILMCKVVADRPEKKRGISAEEVAFINGGLAAEENLSVPGWTEILQLYRQRKVVFMTAATALATAPVWMVGPWNSYGLIVLYQVDADVVAFTLPWLSLMVMAYGFLNGVVVVRLFGGRTRPVLALAPLLSAVGFLAAAYLSVPWLVWAFLIGLLPALCGPMFWGTINSYWIGIGGTRFAGTLNGMGGALQVAVGFVLVSQSGYWIDHAAQGPGKLSPIWVVGGVISLVSIVLIYLSDEVNVRQRAAAVSLSARQAGAEEQAV